jgi:hypothetical protein
MYHIWQTTPAGPWASGWSGLGGVLVDSPSAAIDASGLVNAFLAGSDNTLWYIGQASPGVWF